MPDNLIGTYVYGGDYGLNAVGSTKTGSMLNFQDYYLPQGGGQSVGQAFATGSIFTPCPPACPTWTGWWIGTTG